jgi:glycine oxidase
MSMKIAIAGAGIIGLSTAWRLATAGASVHILDPRPPGHGATLAALAALWPASPLKTDPYHTMDRDSLRVFEAFTREIADVAGLPVTYRRHGRIELLKSAKAAANAQREVAASGGTLDVIDFATAHAANPGLAPFAHGAVRCGLTAQVRIAELVAALVKACEIAGVTFHPATAATGLQTDGDRVRAFETPAGRLEADAFLIAAGAWSATISSRLADVVPVRPAKGQGIAVAMPASPPLTTLIKSGPIYLIPWDDEIFIGSTTEPEAGFDETPTETARQKLLAGAAAIIPQLADAPILRHWAGLRPQNPHKPHFPLMGPVPRFTNLFLSTGHYKIGIALAPLASKLVAECIVENRVPPDLTPFLPRPVTETPPRANP